MEGQIELISDKNSQDDWPFKAINEEISVPQYSILWGGGGGVCLLQHKSVDSIWRKLAPRGAITHNLLGPLVQLTNQATVSPLPLPCHMSGNSPSLYLLVTCQATVLPLPSWHMSGNNPSLYLLVTCQATVPPSTFLSRPSLYLLVTCQATVPPTPFLSHVRQQSLPSPFLSHVRQQSLPCTPLLVTCKTTVSPSPLLVTCHATVPPSSLLSHVRQQSLPPPSCHAYLLPTHE